jgi:hypothetical protein
MFGLPAFYAAGRLFACVHGEGVGLKLPEAMVEELVEMPGVRPFQPYGRPPMREWVQIDREDSQDYADDMDLLLTAMTFAAGAGAPPWPAPSGGRGHAR